MHTRAVIDLSHWNTIPESLEPAREAGIKGIIHKATEGCGFVDSKLAARHHLAKEALLLWGAYHFIRPGSIGAQVGFFLDALKAAGALDEETLLALDYEDPEVSLDEAVQFLEILEDEASRSPVIYSGHVLKEKLKAPDPRLDGYRLWLAQYGPSYTLPNGFKSCWLWQYTDEGVVPGIEPPVDVNAYEGGGSLIAEWAGKERPAHVAAQRLAPKIVAVTITITDPSGKAVVRVDREEIEGGTA